MLAFAENESDGVQRVFSEELCAAEDDSDEAERIDQAGDEGRDRGIA